MRWFDKSPKHGDERVVNRFLWRPTTIGAETRWLECARIRQRCLTARDLCGDPFWWWENLEFLPDGSLQC